MKEKILKILLFPIYFPILIIMAISHILITTEEDERLKKLETMLKRDKE